MLVLSHDDVLAALPMRDCIAAIERMFVGLAQGDYFQPLRTRAHPQGNSNWMTIMPSARIGTPRLWALKEMVVTPSNSARGKDPIQGAVLLHDGDDGRLLAVLSAPALTAIRTAAVSAVATRILARPDARSVAIIGAGVQGRAHVEAMRCVFPQACVRVWSRTQERALALARECDAEPASSIEEALAGADVVCTVTSAREPVIARAFVAQGCHINAVGSSASTHREIDGATMAAASLFVDRRESTLSESGDYLEALAERVIPGPRHIRAELGEVLLGLHPGRTENTEITLFKALGLAIEDLVAAEVAVRIARESGIGQECQW